MGPDIGNDPSRRTIVVLGAGLVAGTGALAACAGSSGTAATVASAPAPAASSAPPSAASAGGGGAGAALAKLSDVPVGGAISAQDAGKPIIIAQPTAGKVVAFTAICTHLGCTVAPSTGTVLKCPCHGSTYDATTGANTGGPAPRPLAGIPVTVSGDSIVAG